MRRNSLKIILLASSTITVILLTAALSSFAYYTAKKYIEETYIDEMKKICRVSAKHIKGFFATQFLQARFISAQPVYVKAVAARDRATLIAMLSELNSKFGIYENVFLSTPEKNPMVFADATGKGLNFRWGNIGFDENIEAALAGKPHLGKVAISPITQEPVVLLTVPVMDNKQVVGILAFSLSMNAVTETVVKDIKIGSDGYIAITDFDGTVVGHPDKSLIMKLNLSKTDWGKSMLQLKSGEYMEYFFKQEKIAAVYRIDEYKLTVAAVVSKDELVQVAHSMLLRILGFAAVFLVISVIFLYRLLSLRLKPLEDARALFRSMSEGDLSKQLEIVHEDEIGDLSRDTNAFLNGLKSSLNDIQRISFDLANSAEKLFSSSENFSNSAQSTAASTEQMSATVEEMSAGMETISTTTENQHRNISDFRIKIEQLSFSIKKIGEEIQNTLGITKAISLEAKKGENSLTGMTNMISNILKSSGEMKAIIGIINDISDQTQLLALNAAIEAARAGEAGKGFAVVAEEISKLSEKTASSIKSISAMIVKNNSELDAGAKGIQSSTEIIHSIIRDVDRVSEAMDKLNEIMSKQEEVNRVVNEKAERVGAESESVKLATAEQRRAVQEISDVIVQINEHTINTATGAEEMSSSSKGLSDNAETLKRIARKFKLN
ncbi:methyl-accepting chemotaxis protein [Leptospira fluminis]|uniref:Methyl-accepting chemotaxis protein n=1 Tax=Leptospira fluminis TaxID=2484979 RepID=A0A4R9GM30_9LEPT|nr:methyl-accepting chemotaxis protein [Leptospira fluminis]TGK15705.1 methyl-accepting chemotaxis protein [Leptospira fluminis]